MTLLNHERIEPAGGAPSSWVLFLHGIYGAGRNWGSIARRVVDLRSDVGAALVDLRGHGESLGFEAPHTLQSAACDVAELSDSLEEPTSAIVGHSFGGKVALQRLASGVQPLPDEVWIIDSTPEAREPDGSAWAMLSVLRRAQGPFSSRTEAVERLTSFDVDEPVARWVSANLERVGGELRWRIDLDVMEALLLDFFRVDLWHVLESPPAETVMHIVKATESSVLGAAAVDRVRAAARANPRVRLHEVEGGHWLNADNPDALVRLMGEG